MAERILIIGGGGREHAIGKALGNKYRELFFASGNAGTRDIGTNVDIPSKSVDRLGRYAHDTRIKLTIVGPEEPLAKGVVDFFQTERMLIFGPTQAAAKLESSKINAACFNYRHGIPQPGCAAFNNYKDATEFIKSPKCPDEIVVKADGLASGKGVFLPQDKQGALNVVEDLLLRRRLGRAGEKILIQRKISGPEVSMFAFADGKTAYPLLAVQDHKLLYGKNTGGMGAYAPVPFVTPELTEQIRAEILQPAISGMRDEGRKFVGVLYAGLMLTKKGPQVLEYNVRFGDPEAQVLLTLFNSDLLEAMKSCLKGQKPEISFKEGSSACVVLASAGYPDAPEKGQVIHGLDKVTDPDIYVYHAGTGLRDGHIITTGGRALSVTAYGLSLQDAIDKAYSAIGENGIHFDGMQYRHDIGSQA